VPSLRCLSSSSALRPGRLVLGIAASGMLVSACMSSSTPAATQAPSSVPASPTRSAGAAATSPAATAPGIVAVTTGGALVRLNPATGATEQTLVSSGVLGDGISVSATGTLYFAVKSGCTGKIESIPASGGTPAVIASGSVPAISPDGTTLAYADEPAQQEGCLTGSADPVSLYHLEIRKLSGGPATALRAVPASQDSGLPSPISHLSWSSDNVHLAVSIAAVQDNEGWGVNLVDTSRARYYLSGTGVTSVPVTGRPARQQSYLREGVYMPDGGLFVSRACCGGDPPRNTSRLMWEVSADGVLTHQVAVGFAALDHTSLDVSADGRWLLYLAGNDLYVSPGGARPHRLRTGLTAAAWG
jgi:WD40-like Beta Propeller Repeat